MALSTELISQLAKITNDSPKKTSIESTSYGTIKEYDGRKYVQLDGSELLTPIETTTSVKDSDRVVVTIKNHTAIVTGNVSDPASSTSKTDDIADQISEFEIIIADKVSVEQLDAEIARIEQLRAEVIEAIYAEIEVLDVKIANIDAVSTEDLEAINAEIVNLKADIADIDAVSAKDLEAINAKIHNLEATYAEFESASVTRFEAVEAEIARLDAEKISTEELDAKYANIDFSNIDEAAIQYLYAESGLIKDVIIEDGVISGELIGVTIKGDLIEGGTIVADKLVIKGEDGLYYRLNTDGVTTEAEQTEYNSINGSIITAQSITATKIAVDDLVAFDATIGGINIGEGKIYSGVKESIGNTTQGMYMDKDGQMALGDGDKYIKYYQDTDGSYKLDVSADNISFTNGGNVADLLNYIRIDANLGTIQLGSSDSAITLTLENDMIVFRKNGTQFGWWDGTDFHTGNIVVEVNERAQLGNFAFVPRSDGSLSFLKVQELSTAGRVGSAIIDTSTVV